jgi:ABC-type transport system substrate-binding protein
MKDSRAGECLWFEWSGDDISVTGSFSFIFFTYDHIDLDEDVIRRALASSLQRDGVVDSLGEGYRAVETADIIHGYVGYVDGEIYLTACDEHGITEYDDVVDSPREATWAVIK